MSLLPKINQPIFEIEIPSTKKKVKVRPFLVKEEKLLLMGLEGGDSNSMAEALKQIIQNCTLEKIDVDKLSSFDLEYFFLRLRAKSISETIELIQPCSTSTCNNTLSFTVDLNSINVQYNPKHSNKIELTETVGIVMKYPTLSLIQSLSGANDQESSYKLVYSCVDYIYDADSVYQSEDTPKEELSEWIDNLDRSSFLKIRDFFETMPKIKHHVSLDCSKCNNKTEFDVEGLHNFF